MPECVAIFSDEKKRINDFLLNWNNRFLDLVKYYSKKKKSYILIGSLPQKKENNKFLNRSLLIDTNGEIVTSYDKINLFDVFLSNKENESLKKIALDSGGLYIIGTERHESRRIDNQLRGRSGRQGDPGSSKFLDHMRNFQG